MEDFLDIKPLKVRVFLGIKSLKIEDFLCKFLKTVEYMYIFDNSLKIHAALKSSGKKKIKINYVVSHE